MPFDNEQALKNALWNIEPVEIRENRLGVCEYCGQSIYEGYEYLESDDNEMFCEDSCFLDHAFENYLHKRN